MKAPFFRTLFFFAVLSLLAAPDAGAQKLKLGSSLRLSPVYDLPYLAAVEKGFWSQNGLEVEWVPFQAGAPLYQAIAAGSIPVSLTMAANDFQARAAGVPTIIVSGLYESDDFYIWVRADSRIRAPADLKGAKIGVVRFRGSAHAYGLMVTKALGIEKEVRFVSAGGIRESLAALRAGATDAAVHPFHQLVEMKLKGEVRDLVRVDDYRPKEWASHVVTARSDFAKKEPDTVKRVVRSILQATEFIGKNRDWSAEKVKLLFGFSDEAAKQIYERFHFTRDGKIGKKALENLRAYLIQYGIVSGEKIPTVEELYTEEFLG